MQRINGSMKAEDAVMIFSEKLSEFGFNLKGHIVGMVTDGAAVAEKTSLLSEVLHQICYLHGIHLTVVDVLYKKSIAVNMKMSHLLGRLSINLLLMKTEILMTMLK